MRSGPEGSCQQPSRQPPCFKRPHVHRDWFAPGPAAVGGADDVCAEPALRLVGPGPVAPFLRLRMGAPGDALGLDAALEVSGDREVDDPGAVGELAEAAVPVARGAGPRQHHLRRRPGDAAVAGARQQRLAAVVVVGEPLLVEDGDDFAARDDAASRSGSRSARDGLKMVWCETSEISGINRPSRRVFRSRFCAHFAIAPGTPVAIIIARQRSR